MRMKMQVGIPFSWSFELQKVEKGKVSLIGLFTFNWTKILPRTPPVVAQDVNFQNFTIFLLIS